jgi:quinol monooxygenase YgiN
MTNALLTVVAEMVAKAGKEEDLKRQVLALVEPTRREEGCVQYDLHQSTGERGRFVFYENWTSRESLERHRQSPHLAAFGAVQGDLLAEPARVLTYTRIA